MVFALTVFFAVAIVSLVVSSMTRRAFQQADEERTAALVAQFRSEFNRRGADVTRRIESIASSDSVTRMALSLSNSAPDYGAYLNEAKSIADSQQLDFLEFTDSRARSSRLLNPPLALATRSQPSQPCPLACS